MRRSLNLIPPATQRREAWRRLSRVWSASVLISASIAGLLLAFEWGRGIVAVRELQSLDARYAPLTTLAKEREELTQQIATLRTREQTALRLTHEQHSLTALAAITLAAAEAGDDVYLESIRYQGHSPTAKNTPSERATVRLQGAGSDSAAIARFAERLRTGGGLSGVAVESTTALPRGGPNHRRFEIVGKL